MFNKKEYTECDSAYWKWEPLAEIRYTKTDSPTEYYCLLSRSVVWPKYYKTPRKADLSGSRTNTDSDDSDDESYLYEYEQRASESIENDWLEYWSVNGDKIVWDSWVDKYRDYISPDYLTNSDNPDRDVLIDPGSRIDYQLPESRGFFRDDDNDSLSSYCSAASSDDSFCTAKSSTGSDKLDFDGNSSSFDDHWSTLWKEHCETEYDKYYQLFISFRSHQSQIAHDRSGLGDAIIESVDALNDSDDSVTLDFNDTACIKEVRHFKNESRHFKNESCTNLSNKDEELDLKTREPSVIETSSLKCSRKAEAAQIEIIDESSDSEIKNCTDVLDCSLNYASGNEESLSRVESDCTDDEAEKLEKELLEMDLPLAFGFADNKRKQKKHKRRGNRKRRSSNSHANEEIRSAFTRAGVRFEQPDRFNSGRVNYLQDARNQSHNWRASMRKRNSHVRFDSDGNVLPEGNGLPGHIAETVSGNAPAVSSFFQAFRPYNLNENSPPMTRTPSRSEESPGLEDVSGNKKRRTSFRQRRLPFEVENNPKLKKYFFNRYNLFSKYDAGILLDEESWYSVTPEAIAKYTAERCECKVIVDAFCGAGGNTIQFALKCDKVIAIDVDFRKIELAMNNARVYGVAHKIEFIVGDFFKLAHKLEADAVFLSPPWGGPDYLNEETYDLVTMLEPKPIADLLEAARKVSNNIAIYLPRNSDIDPLVEEGGLEGVEVEQNFLGSKLMAITAFFSELKKKRV